MLEERAWRQEMLEGNSAEELHELLKKALETELLQAATTLALCLVGHKDVTATQLRFVIANLDSVNALRLIQKAKELTAKEAE
jgi:hypothetical protein